MTEFVSGILFDYQMERFLLINKNGMKLKDGTTMFWQGIGGHLNNNDPNGPLGFELPHTGMEREFEEETGYKLAKKHWHCYYIKTYKDTKIYFFAAFASPSTLTDVRIAAGKHGFPEGQIEEHSIVDVLFDQRQYTFDIPYLVNMIVREMRGGMFMKLDPEGVNSSGKIT